MTLVTGSILIGALGYAAVAIVSAPSNDTASGSDMAGFEQPQAAGVAAAPGAAGAPAEEGDGGPLGGLQSRLASEYDSKLYIYKVHASDAVADPLVDGVSDAVTPGFDAGVNAVDRVLPKFLQGQVPWLAGYAKFVAEGTAADSLGGVVEDQIVAASDAARPEFLGGTPSGGGASAAATTPADGAGGSAPATRPAAPTGAAGTAPAGAAGTAMAAPVQPVAVGMPAPAPTEIYAIRMGRFATVANAEQFAADLGRRGIPAHVAMEQDGGRLWSVVRHGRFVGRGAAEGALRELQGRGYGGTVVSDTGLGGAS
ncbi:SPOR domain-containing protein [Caenispirillum bisanense]|uniref:SPOR domain-containing protein n=1 Tax=Caenispirillum bisanense TaxID=414052 RepID=UPI0011443D3B|nr:SPOR domain-containing protein [Caenispirillum bisanense]